MINLTATSSSSYNAQLVISDSKQESTIEMAESANISITSLNGDGVTVSLSESSQSYYHQSKVQAPEIVAPVREPEEQSPAQTAQNIIEPVREKLTEANDAGADRKELRGLMRDALRGFRQGFREAVKTIRHSGNMDPELRSELRETRQMVRQGFRELRQEFLPRRQPDPILSSDQTNTPAIETKNSQPSKPESTKPALTNTLTPAQADNPSHAKQKPSDKVPESSTNDDLGNSAPAVNVDRPTAEQDSIKETKAESLPAKPLPGISYSQASNFSQSFAIANRNAYSELQNLAESISASYDRSQSAVIEITTQDGDTISIDIASAIKASKSINGMGDIEFSLQAQDDDSFVIEGELDADEIKALDSILEQVNGLASKFFNGNVAAAFKEAMNIGLDPNEIASFSLSLNQSTNIEASRAYLVSDGSDSAGEQLQKQSRLLSLSDYVVDMQKVLETATKFSNSANMVEKLLDKEMLIHHDHQPQNKRDLFNQLNENVLKGLDVQN